MCIKVISNRNNNCVHVMGHVNKNCREAIARHFLGCKLRYFIAGVVPWSLPLATGFEPRATKPVPAQALGEVQAGGQLGFLCITRLYFALCMRQRYIEPLAYSLIFEQ